MINTEIVYRFFKEGYESKNYDFVMKYLADDYIDHSPAGARGNAQAVGILKTVADQFSDLSIQMLDIFADNEMVATRVLYQGVHSGTCMGIAATGKRFLLKHWRTSRLLMEKLWNPGDIGLTKKLKKSFDHNRVPEQTQGYFLQSALYRRFSHRTSLTLSSAS